MTINDPAYIPLVEQLKSLAAERKDVNDRQFVTALGRGLILLTAFEHHEYLSHQQLCQMTDLPKATVTRLIHTLVTLGFLRVTAHGQYHLGGSPVRLSATAWNRHDIVAIAAPLLRQFASEHKVSVNLATDIEGEMRYLACCRSPARLSVNLQVGSTVPIAQTAIGRALYVASTPNKQAIMRHSLQKKLTHTEYQQAEMALAQASAYYLAHGYTLSDGEFSTDILAVAVPVMNTTSGQYEYSLNASVPRINWDADDYAVQIVANLQWLAKKLEG